MATEITDSKLIDGKCLIVKNSVSKGETVFVLTGEIFDHPTRESIHIGENKHIYDDHGIFINHSFTPSVCISGVNVVALEDMTNGTEITFNYNDSELAMANPFYVGDAYVNGSSV